MVFPLIPVIVIGVFAFLGISIVGGVGLTFSLFKGLSTIPPFIWIAVGITIIFLLFRGKR